MKPIKVSEASGTVLDWMVCSAQYPEATMSATHVWLPAGDAEDDFLIERTSTDWAQGGPIIEREHIALVAPGNRIHVNGGPNAGWSQSKIWTATSWKLKNSDGGRTVAWDETRPLVAAMRFYVTCKLGSTVEVPEELL